MLRRFLDIRISQHACEKIHHVLQKAHKLPHLGDEYHQRSLQPPGHDDDDDDDDADDNGHDDDDDDDGDDNGDDNGHDDDDDDDDDGDGGGGGGGGGGDGGSDDGKSGFDLYWRWNHDVMISMLLTITMNDDDCDSPDDEATGIQPKWKET